MCGIAGLFNVSDYAIDQQKSFLHFALDEMYQRGPDDFGVWINGDTLIGHRRLAVIDIQGARQPWVDEDTGCVLTYNGEIYNYVDLRERLRTLGHKFRSRSDTEVLLRAYVAWGQGCLEYLDGIFAFAIYDPRNQSLFMARDRVGVKPLFYFEHNGGLVFASSIAALLKIPVIPRRLSLPAVSHYLTTLRTSLGHLSMIEGVYCLQPGHSLTISKGVSARVRCYWEYPVLSPEDKVQLDFSDAVEQVAVMVKESVNKQLVSDVDVGCFLSGGLDSSIITSLVSQKEKRKVYNVGYRDDGFNEWSYVDEVVESFALDCKKEELFVEDYKPVWENLIASKGLPLSSPNEVPIFHLASLLKQECTVALSGEGADEVFGGYGVPYFSAYDFDRAQQLSLNQGRGGQSDLELSLQQLYGRSSFGSLLDHFFLLNSWIPFAVKSQLFMPDVWSSLGQDDQLFNYYEALFARLRQCSTFDQYLHVHARINLEGLLFRVDSSTMAASVEARVPFTDHHLLEYLFALPDDFKMDWKTQAAQDQGSALNAMECNRLGLFETKKLLRGAFKHSLPEKILNRPKMSFPVPFMNWFGTVWKDEAGSIINDASISDSLFSQEVINHYLNSAQQSGSSQALWPLCNLAIWMKSCKVEC